jgi:hypothetical protein
LTQFSFEQAVDVWMRHFSGQYQHQIAAAYVINVRAVNHVLKEKTHLHQANCRGAVQQVGVNTTGRAVEGPPVLGPVAGSYSRRNRSRDRERQRRASQVFWRVAALDRRAVKIFA